MRASFVRIALATVLAACTDAPTAVRPPADTPERSASGESAEILLRRVTQLPFDFPFWNPCAPGGGEMVQLDGELQLVSLRRHDANGTFRWTYHTNPKGISGVGLTTGATYRFVGSETTQTTRTTDGGGAFDQTAILQLVRQGDGASLSLKVLVRVDFVDGRPVPRIREFTLECKGN